MDDARKYYSDTLSGLVCINEKLTKQIRTISVFRLLSFIALIGLPVILRKNMAFVVLSAFLMLILFLWLVKKNQWLEKRRERNRATIKILNHELMSLNGDFLQFAAGDEFIDSRHAYTYDMDIFGQGSLFQFINRTTTRGGSFKLAQMFQYPMLDGEEIYLRQQSIAEISKLREWRTDFLTEGNLLEATETEKTVLLNDVGDSLKLKGEKFLKFLLITFPVFAFLSLAWLIFLGSHLLLLLTVIISIGIISYYWKTISYYSEIFGNKTKLIQKYGNLLKTIEKQSFESSDNWALQQVVSSPEKASECIDRLRREMAKFEYRNNLLVGFVLDIFLLWDLRCMLSLQQWYNRHYKKLSAWIDAVEEIDARISLGFFADNNSDFIYPQPVEGNFVFEARGLGHPLLKYEKRVTNDFVMDGWAKIAIITGANMAGKSTFLRTIGVNMILGRMGAPVCAAEMRFSAVNLYSSMRTTDSLLKDESYFLAELRRLAAFIKRLNHGETMFVIIDEMLKGTNSGDKLKGSQQLIRKLVKTTSSSIIATHDVKLTEMESEFLQNILNYCFEIEHQGEEMVFDYKLRRGVTKTMNASLLMRKLGILDGD